MLCSEHAGLHDIDLAVDLICFSTLPLAREAEGELAQLIEGVRVLRSKQRIRTACT